MIEWAKFFMSWLYLAKPSYRINFFKKWTLGNSFFVMCCISSCKSAMTYKRYISRNLLISLFLSPATKFPSKISLVTFSLQKELMTIIAFSKDSSSKILSYISYRIVSAMRKTTGDPFTKNKSHTKYSVSRGNSPTKSTMSHLNIF